MSNIWGIVFPKANTTRPSDMAGMTNGLIDPALLVNVGIRGSQLHHLANRGFQCFLAYARANGFDVDLASIDPRTYEQQRRIFDRRKYPMSGRYLPGEMWAAWEKAGGKWAVRDSGTGPDIRVWRAPERPAVESWKRIAGAASAAKPGTSPHGDALATDVALRWPDGHYPPQSVTEKFARWMKDSGIVVACGFHWSLDQEPWHIQWTSGDVVPPFVIAWENPTPPEPGPEPPPPNPGPQPEEEDMFWIVDYGFEGVDPWWTRMYIDGGNIGWVQGKANSWTEPDNPAMPGPDGGPKKLDEFSHKHIQVENDQHIVDLLATYRANSPCPSTFQGRLATAWAWSLGGWSGPKP